MLLATVVGALLAAQPVSIGISGLRAVNLSDAEAGLYSELIGQKLRARGAKVVTSRELSEVLGVERQRQLAGCGEESCVAEVLAAMGTDLILFGDVARPGARYTLNLRLVSAKEVKPVAQYTSQVDDADAMPEELDRAARALLVQAYAALGRADLDPGPEPRRPQALSRRWGLVTGGVALVGLAVGAGFMVQAAGQLNVIATAPTAADAKAARDTGLTAQAIAWTCFGVGAAGLVATVAVLLLGGEHDVTPSVSVSGSGAGFGLVGRLP